MYMDWHGWGMGGGWMFMILFWGLIIAALVAAVAYLTKKTGSSGSSGESPMDILKKRFAKGEISREEYERMKKDIGDQ